MVGHSRPRGGIDPDSERSRPPSSLDALVGVGPGTAASQRLNAVPESARVRRLGSREDPGAHGSSLRLPGFWKVAGNTDGNAVIGAPLARGSLSSLSARRGRSAVGVPE
jgi:hypothetical protein